MASSESAYIFAMVWAHSGPLAGRLKRSGDVRVGSVVGLLSKGSLEEAIGDVSLAGGLDVGCARSSGFGRFGWHGEAKKLRAGEDCGGECGGESEDLCVPFEYLLIHGVQLKGRGRYESTGVIEAGDEGAL